MAATLAGWGPESVGVPSPFRRPGHLRTDHPTPCQQVPRLSAIPAFVRTAVRTNRPQTVVSDGHWAGLAVPPNSAKPQVKGYFWVLRDTHCMWRFGGQAELRIRGWGFESLRAHQKRESQMLGLAGRVRLAEPILAAQAGSQATRQRPT